MTLSITGIVISICLYNPCIAADNAKQTDEQFRLKIKDVSDSAHHLRETAREIVYEVTRQNYIAASEPNIIGPIIIPATPEPTGLVPIGGYATPRKKYMDFYISQVHSLLTLLSEEGSLLPDNWQNNAAVNNYLAKIKQDLTDLQVEIKELEKLSTAQEIDNETMAKEAMLISDECDEIKKFLRECDKHIEEKAKHGD